MFDFFFKRFNPPGKAAAAGPASSVPVETETENLRRKGLDRLNALGDDESALAAFILDCGEAALRLEAAQKIHTRALLDQILKAMRDTDRRVARLMQQRLDALTLQERSGQQAQSVLERAHALHATPALLANQVVDLERAWQEIGAAPQTMQDEFSRLHAQLAARLYDQAKLQRLVLDTIASVRSILSASTRSSPAIAVARAAAASTLEQARLDSEMPSLPKPLLPELTRLQLELGRLADTAAQEDAAVAAREQAIAQWSVIAPPVTPLLEMPVEPLAPSKSAEDTAASGDTRESMRRRWGDLAPVSDPETRDILQARFDGLLESMPASAKPRELSKRPTSTEATEHRMQFAAALEGLQAALDEGSLQKAVEHDRLLRQLDPDAGKSRPLQQAALNTARAELARLQGWAKWGGTVSREEMLAAVEALAGQALPIGELAKKVGSMRERWRALDNSAGPAPRPFWLRFDAACTAAYAPVAAHFAALTQERATNAVKAQGLLDDMAAFIQSSGAGETGDTPGSNDPGKAPASDWRAIAAFCQGMRQAWQRLGPLERREQKRLDAAFASALLPLQGPLEARQELEVVERERMISEAMLLPPQARDTPQRLQALQAQWQQHAKSFPLARQPEQVFWQRFRAACDAVYAHRKAAGAAADVERSAHQQAREAVCAQLEQAVGNLGLAESERANLLRATRAAWNAAGPAPRMIQETLQQRFDAALKALEKQQLAGQQEAARRRYDAFVQKLRICLACESAVIAGAMDMSADFRGQWLAAPDLPPELVAVLGQRLDRALGAMAGLDAGYARLLEHNRALRDDAILRLEVVAGLDSPPGWARQRLALQVANLQSTLHAVPSVPGDIAVAGRADGKPGTVLARFVELLSLPAVADADAQARMEHVARAVLIADGH